MRLVVVGRDSFIAQHVLLAAASEHLEALSFDYDADISSVVRETDTIINFALNPSYSNTAYSEDFDCDLRVARIAARAGARTAMASSRRVYPDGARWNAKEDGPSSGDETTYGKNKARTEAAIKALPGARVAIFRLSNVFGYEYSPQGTRRTFLAQLSRSLKDHNLIRFDMHPDTRRDFIPVEVCAGAIMAAMRDGVEGTYNLGVDFPIRCGDLADWLREGFGGGELVVDPPIVRDEFFLNIDRWKSRFPAPFGPDELRDYCVELGRRLQCAKS